jgi:hypothetical protein
VRSMPHAADFVVAHVGARGCGWVGGCGSTPPVHASSCVPCVPRPANTPHPHAQAVQVPAAATAVLLRKHNPRRVPLLFLVLLLSVLLTHRPLQVPRWWSPRAAVAQLSPLQVPRWWWRQRLGPQTPWRARRRLGTEAARGQRHTLAPCPRVAASHARCPARLAQRARARACMSPSTVLDGPTAL